MFEKLFTFKTTGMGFRISENNGNIECALIRDEL